jgi:hypothetical protein
MPITRASLEDVTESDLLELIEDQVAEGLFIDYKWAVDAGNDDGKRKILKEASSFANMAGGHLVVGMAEEEGLPTELVGLDGNLDAEMQRLENLFRDCIEPRIVGMRMKSIPLRSGRGALIIRVPRSWNPPHAAAYKGSRRYFARNSAGAHEASVEELRAMFTAGATLLDRVREFRGVRLRAIDNNHTPIQVGAKGRMVLHLVPFSAFSSSTTIDLQKMSGVALMPIYGSGYNPRYNADGLLAWSGNDPEHSMYVQVFRNGIMEACAGGVCIEGLAGRQVLYAMDAEDQVLRRLGGYLAGLSAAGVAPPVAVLLSGVRLRDVIVVGNPVGRGVEVSPLQHSELTLPEVVLEDFGTSDDHRRELKPVFDALWNAAGYATSQSYGPDGRWVRAASLLA